MTTKVKGLMTLSIVLLASVLLVIGTHMVFNPIKVERENKATLSLLENYFAEVTDFETNNLETIEGVEILRSVRILKDEEPLGYLYEANIVNSFGNMKVRISVDVKDIIQTAEFIEMNQTMYQTQTQNMLQTYPLNKLNADIFDGAAGATSISKNDLAHLMSMVGLHHDSTDKFEVVLPYSEFYGEDYVISSTENISEAGASMIKEVIEGQGVVYTVTKSGIYQTDSIEEKSITLVIALDNDNKIIGILLPVELYNHTKGNFMASALVFAESFVGINLADITDGNTGASGDGSAHNSRNLIEDIVFVVQGVHLS